MLGKAVAAHWRRRQRAVLALGHEHADVTDADRLIDWADAFRPEIVINCAAFTAVDRCEHERERAFAINGDGVGNVVAAAERIGAGLIQLSSDYVFDGTKREPYVESDPTGPLSAYGRTKLAAEREVEAGWIVRTAWLFGANGRNFVRTMLQ